MTSVIAILVGPGVISWLTERQVHIPWSRCPFRRTKG